MILTPAEIPDDNQLTFPFVTHHYICCGIFRQLHCYWPLSTSPTNTAGFALIKMTSCTSLVALRFSTCQSRTAPSDSLKGVAGIEARNVLEVGQMFPHWLNETNLFLDRGCWYELNYKHALQWHCMRGSSAWNRRGDILLSHPLSHGTEATLLTY